LGEDLLNLPKVRHADEGYLKVHPEFRAIFTSNPEEYAGIHKSQDALMDRLITIHVGHYDRQTEVAITAAKTGVSAEEAERIVAVVRHFRRRSGPAHQLSIRAAIAIGRVVKRQGAACHPSDPVFLRTCRDVLDLDRASGSKNGTLLPEMIDAQIEKVWGLVGEAAGAPQ